MIALTHFIFDFALDPVLDKIQFYRFRTTITDFTNKRRVVENVSTRDVELVYLGKIRDLFYFDVFTSKVTLTSNQSIQNERLLKEDIYAFGDILLGVNDKGEIKKIKNLKEMQQRWAETKAELRKDHVGFEFEDFLSDITEVLEDEEKTVYFLKTNAMFGLYFHGLFGKNDVQKMPIKRKSILLDLDDTEITEEIWIDKRGPQVSIGAQKSDDANKKIISNNVEIQGYQGTLTYGDENQLIESNLKIETEHKNIKYSVIWVG
ncbi:hypothetical protein FNW52_19845 [Flavobacterium sp. ZT3R18]|uniref:hypothetical protein n=1 Tax=Flavobacterium sp. ZT3R18 TaxID=2594429 RepID=UPI00117B46C3|nr:hypothetical protein [Flavobacterium sp. ZT3R18]TRX30655.1 hypothetical protein FNW52_19845 [Flavobacterium sp. ZT3R18]